MKVSSPPSPTSVMFEAFASSWSLPLVPSSVVPGVSAANQDVGDPLIGRFNRVISPPSAKQRLSSTEPLIFFYWLVLPATRHDRSRRILAARSLVFLVSGFLVARIGAFRSGGSMLALPSAEPVSTSYFSHDRFTNCYMGSSTRLDHQL